MKYFDEEYLSIQKDLLKGNFDSFISKISELYDGLIYSCNLIVPGIFSTDIHSMLYYIDSIKDDENNYILNISKGFVYILKSHETKKHYKTNNTNTYEEKAYKYLSFAIIIKKTESLPYSLLAEIDIKINPLKVDHAKMAYQLNPSSRNYFLLLENYQAINTSIFNNDILSSIEFFKKLLDLNISYPCFFKCHNFKIYEKSKEYINSLINFKNIIEIENDPLGYEKVWDCLNIWNFNYDAIYIAQKGLQIYPENKNYLYKLGISNFKNGKNEIALNYIKEFLSFYPDDKKAKDYLRHVEITNHDLKLDYANRLFNKKNYQDSLKYYETCLNESEYMPSANIRKYFFSFFKVKNPTICIEDRYLFYQKLFNQNLFYQKLMSLKTEYELKSKNGEPLTKEETSFSKLKIYNSDSIIGFGKYKGERVIEIIEKDSEYILWCIINLLHFTISDELLILKNVRIHPLYNSALEHNMIKEMIILEEFFLMKEEDDGNINFDTDYKSFGYKNEDDFVFWAAFDGNIDAWNHYNQ